MKTRKADCRAQVKELLRAMSDVVRAEKSAKICEHIAGLAEWSVAGCAGLFAGLRGEPAVAGLCGGGKLCGYPRVEGDELGFYEIVDVGDLVAGAFGVREPGAGARRIEVAALEVLLVPGLAFDETGMRLGRGGGFYDRLLALPDLRARLVGVCFEVQVLPELPVEAHDRAVDAVVTENGVRIFS